MTGNGILARIKNGRLIMVSLVCALTIIVSLFACTVIKNNARNASVHTAYVSGPTSITPYEADTSTVTKHISTDKATVKVAVLDTGIDINHPALSIAGGVSLLSYTNSWNDDNGHGTHVAGIITNTLEELGALDEVDLYSVKVIDQNGKGYVSDVISGINWAVANKMDVIVMTFTTSKDSSKLHLAVDEAYKQGLVLIAAAGNAGYEEGKDTIMYPARYDSVISVGSVDNRGERLSTSSVGDELEVVAPGAYIYSTVPGGYAWKSGTSMAAADVAGMAAYLKTIGVSSNLDIRAKLDNTAKHLGEPGRNSFYGWGLVNVEAAQ